MATFGKNTTTGAGAVSAASGATFYMRIQMGAVSGTATSISWYTASTAGSNIKFALYADASTLPTTVLGSGTGSVSTTTGWNTINLSSSVAVTASTWYWIGVRAATATTNVYYATVRDALQQPMQHFPPQAQHSTPHIRQEIMLLMLHIQKIVVYLMSFIIDLY
jgi:hypothetical protein